MAIPAETRSSEHLLGYGSYHVAALKADPESAHLTAAVEELIGALRTAFAAREAAEQAELEAFARYNRADFELDEACRICEIEVLAAVGKDRAHADYRAAFPKSLSALVADRVAPRPTRSRRSPPSSTSACRISASATRQSSRLSPPP